MAAQLPPEDEAVRVLPFEAKAQHYLDTQEYLRLRQVLDGWSTVEEAKRSLDWLQQKMLQGETIEIAYIYASNLWRFASSVPPSSPYVKFKSTAAMATTYAFAVIAVDGQKCKDSSAPGHNIENNLSNWGKVTWLYSTSAPQAEREAIINTALAIEKKTATLRKNDRFVCGGGIEEWKHADLSKGREVPTPTGGVGRTVLVQNDSNYLPELKSATEYLPLQEKMRSQLPAMIAGIIEKISSIKH